MKISWKLVIFTFAVLVGIQEIAKDAQNISSKEKYLNPLIINKGLIQSIRTNNEKNMDKYLGYEKLRINTETTKGNTPLMEAIMCEKISMDYFVKILAMSDVNHVNKHGFSPIHIAITSKNKDKIKKIFETPGFAPEVKYNGQNLVEFAEALKNNEKDLKGRMQLNEIVAYLKKKAEELNEQTR